MLNAYRQAGVTLVEVMIASSIALFALSALFTVYGATAQHSSHQLRQADLHQQLHAVMQLLTRDLQRSGYWYFDPRSQSPTDNPFIRPVNRLRVGSYHGEAVNSCILLAYDLDRDGHVGYGRCDGGECPAQGDDDNVEQFGYRLRDGLVQSRYGGRTFSCDSGYWQALTDSTVEITRLEFTQHTSCINLGDPQQVCAPGSAQLVRRAIETRLTGRSRNGSSPALELSSWTRIHNDALWGGG